MKPPKDCRSGPRRTLLAGLALAVFVVAAAARGADAASARPDRPPDGAAVLAAYIDALGGADAIRRHDTVTMTGTFEIEGAPEFAGVVRICRAAPNLYLREIEIPNVGTQRLGYDGTRGWSVGIDGAATWLDGSALSQLADDAQVDAWLRPAEFMPTFEVVGEETIDDVPCVAVRVVSRAGRESTQWFDAANGLRQRIESVDDGRRIIVTESDYATHDGLRFAMTRTINIGPVRQHLRFSTVSYDAIDPARFGAPADLAPPVVAPAPPPPPDHGHGGGRPGAAPALPDEPRPDVEVPSAPEILARHVAAIGGAAALEALSSRTIRGRYTRGRSGTPMAITVYAAAPDRYLMVGELQGGGESRQGYIDGIAWYWNSAQGPRSVRILSGTDLELHVLEATFRRDLAYDRLFTAFESGGIEPFDGAWCFETRATLRSGIVLREYFDIASGLRRGMSYDVQTSRGPLPVTITLSDYREFDGVRLPTRREHMSVLLERFEYDDISHAPIAPDVFMMPDDVRRRLEPETPDDPSP